MAYITLEESGPDKVLLVLAHSSPLSNTFFDYFSAHGATITIRKRLPLSIKEYDYCIVFEPKNIPYCIDRLAENNKGKHCLLLLKDKDYSYATYTTKQSRLNNIKVIQIDRRQKTQEVIDTIIWFMQSSGEIKLSLIRKEGFISKNRTKHKKRKKKTRTKTTTSSLH